MVMINILIIKLLVYLIGFITPLALQPEEPEKERIPEHELLYSEICTTGDMPSAEVFELAFKGYSNLKESNSFTKNILTIADFSLPSTEKRLWVIDVYNKKVLFNELVAHGRNSGDNYAGKFSNTPSTNMSSLGFYVTGETYTGKHGLSLYLDGMDQHFNNNARRRAIVIHGADYVSPEFIKQHGRLGRSFGCPALSMDCYQSVIESISKGSCLFIYYPDEEFQKKSSVLNMVL